MVSCKQNVAVDAIKETSEMKHRTVINVSLVIIFYLMKQVDLSCIHALMSGSNDNCQTVITTKTDLWGVCEIKDCEDWTTLLTSIRAGCKQDVNTQVTGG